MTDYFQSPTEEQHRRSRIAIQSRHRSEAGEAARAKRRRVDELHARLEYGVDVSYESIGKRIRWG